MRPARAADGETGSGPVLARYVVDWDGRELEALRRCVQRGRAYGRPEWLKDIAKRLGLESAYRRAARPRKVGNDASEAREE